MSKKVLMLLSKEFITDPRVNKEAKSLMENDCEVTVICWDRKSSSSLKEIFNGIQVVRIQNTFFMKILPHDLLRNPFWWMNAYKKGIELYKQGFHFDAVHCHDLDTLVAGMLLKNKLGVKLIYDAHEVFGYMIEQNMPQIVVWFSFFMEKKLLHFVDQVITADVGYADYFEKITDKPVSIVRNCKDIILKKYQPPPQNTFSLIYIGTLSKSRFFPDALSVADEIDNIVFVIAAKKEGLFDLVSKISKDTKNVDFLGTIPLNKVIPQTLNSHVILCLFDPKSRLNQIGSPNKLFEAMVCGRPVIASKGTFSGTLVEKLQMGIAIDFSKNGLKKAIEYLRDNPQICKTYGQNALNAGKSKYNWSKQEKTLLNIYNKINDDS